VPNTKISALPAAAALGGPEILPGVQSGADVGVTASQLQAFATGFPGWVSSFWYAPMGVTFYAGGGALANGSIRLMPFWLPAPMTVKGLGGRVTSAGSSNIQLALYAHAPATGRPTGPALCATANIPNGALNVVQLGVTPVQLAAGIYWMAVNCNDSTCAMLTSGLAGALTGSLAGSSALLDISGSIGSVGFYLSFTQPFGTWPNLTGQTFTANSPSNNTTNGSAVLFLQSN
jgi:hypothetical protein